MMAYAGLGRLVSPAINKLNGFRVTGPATLGARTGVIATRTSDPRLVAQAYVWAAAQCAEGRRIFYVTSDNQFITVTKAPSLFLWSEALPDPWMPSAATGQYVFELGCMEFSAPSPPESPQPGPVPVSQAMMSLAVLGAIIAAAAAGYYLLTRQRA